MHLPTASGGNNSNESPPPRKLNKLLSVCRRAARREELPVLRLDLPILDELLDLPLEPDSFGKRATAPIGADELAPAWAADDELRAAVEQACPGGLRALAAAKHHCGGYFLTHGG